ncbi:MAG: glycoside hydrolase family 30 beta sandwich domain-containing protein [Bacteroidota bacterium]
MKSSTLLSPAFLGLLILSFSCKSGDAGTGPGGSGGASFEFWLTNADRSVLFQKQPTNQTIPVNSSTPEIQVDEAVTGQSMEGFGCALTGASAQLINGMGGVEQNALLQELFATDGSNIGISYLRISIGSSDLDDHVFSYDDMPPGSVDTALTHFSLDPDRTALIPVLKKILAINPDLKILGSPWSPPTWMKTNNSSIGGSLKPQYYGVYANYFVKYIRGMMDEGVHIDAITVQNEPLYGGNNPSMVMQASEEALFIKSSLGPAFAASGISTKIIIYDHNADRTDYPMSILGDTSAGKYVDGSAFHLYGGSINDLTRIHNAYPQKNLYFTEYWVGAPGNFSSDFPWHIKNLIIGGPNNWCRNVLEWNLASDPTQSIHTPGGCSQCLGAVTINGSTVVRNPAYYIMAHAAKFVRPGSVRINSIGPISLPNVAYRRPDGKRVLIVLNDSQIAQTFKIIFGSTTLVSELKAQSAGTYVW